MKPPIKLPPVVVAYLIKLKPLALHHYFVFLLLLLLGLTLAVYQVNQILSMPTDENYRQEKLSSGLKVRFDQDTIEKVKSLQKSSEQATGSEPLPAGRINPFAE
ncbi:MAG: hypothetical protein ACREGJ_03480 [Candidatus Saccharimonadales bacterium]